LILTLWEKAGVSERRRSNIKWPSQWQARSERMGFPARSAVVQIVRRASQAQTRPAQQSLGEHAMLDAAQRIQNAFGADVGVHQGERYRPGQGGIR
jgi:hypothetical protein